MAQSFLDNLPSIEEVQRRVNERYDELFKHNKDGSVSPYVCTVCDEFILSSNEMRVLTVEKMKKAGPLLSWDSLAAEDRITDVESHYTFGEEVRDGSGNNIVKGLALSPRGSMYQKPGRPQKPGFTCCEKCHSELVCRKPRVPFFAIINKNYVGCAPKCLTDLNEIELAFLCPVSTHGICHTYTGGRQLQLKGTVCFMRIQERRITEAAAALENLSLTKHVVVLCHGKMTEKQRQRVNARTQVRVGKVIEAAKWLSENHVRWKGINFEEVKNELKDKRVIRVDHAEIVESSNATVESEEIFTCYYPEGNANTRCGGFDEPGAFAKFADDMAKKKYDIELKVNLERRFVKDNDSDQLVGSCLLQFPYGRGGLDELRVGRDGTASSSADMEEFMGHFSRLSKREFQKPMIQLIYYSMISRARLLKRSRLQVKGEKSAKDLAEGLNPEDVTSTIDQRRRGNRYGGTRVSRKLLDAVEACSRALPHTNEAARVARTTAESLQHYMGSGSIFLTVTFDDENSLLMQVLSGIEVDDDRDISELTDKELRERRRDRREIRLQFPGIAAVHFEMLFEILVEEVVGWSMKNNCATDKPGFFGIPEAFAAAMEEQGRMTVHGHMRIWIKAYRELQRLVFFGVEREKKGAENILKEYNDRISSTSLIQSNKKRDTCVAAWDHECTRENKRQRLLPVVVTDQQLRYLRHRKGYAENKGCFANCPHCKKTWTYEELVCGFLSQGNQCVGYTKETVDSSKAEKMEIPRHRCFAEVVRYQKNFSSDAHLEAPETAINAVYQSHRSCHVDSCFRCTKKGNKNKHVCGPSCECRYRLPDRKRKNTYIKTEHTGAPWYAWNGEEREQPIVQVCSKRNTYDLFQNISCPAVSLSKFGCNSNVQLITDGPIGQYQFKYTFKPTQDDDTKEYAAVDASIKALTGRVHESDRSEAIRRITRAAFAHNKTNVISPSFASYLTRNDSRFYFSHQFTFCPLKDVMSLHRKQKVSSVLKYSRDGTSYFENQALHYLCRPKELEELSLKAFFERYEVTYVKKKGRQTKGSNDNPVMPFIATNHFHHPSIRKGPPNEKVQEAKQGVKCRNGDVWIKISQWLFPDTSNFHGEDIRTCHERHFNKASEQYAEATMTLLYPHRHLGDLTRDSRCTFPYTRKFQNIWSQDEDRRRCGEEPVLFTTENMAYLQNIQDCARNSLRYKIDADDLQAGTEPFHPNESNLDHFDTEENTEDVEENAYYEMFLQYLNAEERDIPNADDADPSKLHFNLQSFTFKHLRAKGTHRCGFHARDRLPSIPEETNQNTFLKVGLPGPTPVEAPAKSYAQRKKYTQLELVRALFKKTTRKPRTDILEGMQLELSDANGSVESIREWGSAVFASDKRQRRAFETIISAFLLTFFNDVDTGEEDVGDVEPTRTASPFRKAKLALLRLKGERGAHKDPQLIALLHGPGGSGKSTVINMVQAYAQSYCNTIGHEFTNRTILITAMSGVAATLLKGNTTHKVMGLNRGSIPKEMTDEFNDSRLLIIDEISFASAKDIEKLHQNCTELMQNHYTTYGGLNVVFAGDFSQLKPVGEGKGPLYDDYCPAFHGKLNCFIELDGKWRFKNDTAWGEILLRFREGCPTVEDIRTINKHCNVSSKTPPAGLQVATFKNVNRDAVNSALFEEYCKENKPRDDGDILQSAVVIFMDNLEMKNSRQTHVPVKSNAVKRHFYEHCGENDCDVSNRRGRIDPVLKVYYNCPLMLTQNKNVENGQANGSRVRLQSVKLKVGEEPFPLVLACGTTVRAVYASQVQCLEVKHEATDISPQTFQVNAEKTTFTGTIRIGTEECKTGMTGNQFPLISNSCTTGHKLQGCTCSSILVNEWFYGSNWPYVVLSRVRTMAGLYIMHDLDEDVSRYAMPGEMTRMLNAFRETIALRDVTDEEYEELLKDTGHDPLPPTSPGTAPRQRNPNSVTP